MGWPDIIGLVVALGVCAAAGALLSGTHVFRELRAGLVGAWRAFLALGEPLRRPRRPPRSEAPKRGVELVAGGWKVEGWDSFVTTDKVLAVAVAAELDRRWPLPTPERTPRTGDSPNSVKPPPASVCKPATPPQGPSPLGVLDAAAREAEAGNLRKVIERSHRAGLLAPVLAQLAAKLREVEADAGGLVPIVVQPPPCSCEVEEVRDGRGEVVFRRVAKTCGCGLVVGPLPGVGPVRSVARGAAVRAASAATAHPSAISVNYR